MYSVRVGFVLGQVTWLGGVNYFRNIFTALQSLDKAVVRPVVFAGIKSDVKAFEGLAEIVRTPMLDRHSIPWLAHKILGKALPSLDPLLDALLKKHKIQAVFHFGTLWRGSSVPSMGWIPDFQHVYYPNFFSDKECNDRDVQFANIVERCSSLVLSSLNALSDLQKTYPGIVKPTHILRFVSSVCPNLDSLPMKRDLIKKYKLTRPWLHVPNQFWIHKNHDVIIDALRLLKSNGHSPLVVSTGKTDDYRNAEYFPSLMKRINELGLQDEFRILGIVPYEDVVSLMFYSTAVINPSLFEGWSTSVEEAKALGKKVLLSNIPVHLEQAPARGEYFDPRNSEALASLILMVMQNYSEATEQEYFTKAKMELLINGQAFAREFETICIETAALGRNLL